MFLPVKIFYVSACLCLGWLGSVSEVFLSCRKAFLPTKRACPIFPSSELCGSWKWSPSERLLQLLGLTERLLKRLSSCKLRSRATSFCAPYILHTFRSLHSASIHFEPDKNQINFAKFTLKLGKIQSKNKGHYWLVLTIGRPHCAKAAATC